MLFRSLIWTKEQLVAPLQPGMEAPPHPMLLGLTEGDYYRLGDAGPPAGRPADDAPGTGEHASGEQPAGEDGAVR